MSRRLRRTKIVTTLGPATDRDNNLEKIIAAGANVVRMNSLTVRQKTINYVPTKCVKSQLNWAAMLLSSVTCKVQNPRIDL